MPAKAKMPQTASPETVLSTSRAGGYIFPTSTPNIAERSGPFSPAFAEKEKEKLATIAATKKATARRVCRRFLCFMRAVSPAASTESAAPSVSGRTGESSDASSAVPNTPGEKPSKTK